MFDESIFFELCQLIDDGGEVRSSADITAKKYGTTTSRLLKWFYERRLPLKSHRNSLLSNRQEMQLVYATIAMSHVNLDWSARDLQSAVKTMFGIEVSLGWAYVFFGRNSNVLSFRTPTPLGHKRLNIGLYDEALAFFDRYQSFLKGKSLPAKAFVNYDECRICINDQSLIYLRRLTSRKKKKPQSELKVKGKHCGTFLPFVAANGDHLASYFILPKKFENFDEAEMTLVLPSSFSRTRGGTASPVLFFNDTGYLNGEIFTEIMEDFCALWMKRYPGLHCCLIGDNLAIHRDIEVLKSAMDCDVYMTFLPAGTTHWSQPLDNLLFARLKQEVRAVAQHLLVAQVFTDEDIFSLVEIVLEAAKKAFTGSTIISAFSGTGIFPPDKEKFGELAHLNHHPSQSTCDPEDVDDFIVEKVVEGLQKCMDVIKEDVSASLEKVTTIRVTVKKNKKYFAADIIREFEQQKEALENDKKEKAIEKEKKENERKRKREEKERKKEEKAQLRDERAEKKAKLLEARARKRSANTCKAGCNQTCRIGCQWVGCESCEEFWMCPACYKTKGGQHKMKTHERLCSRRTTKK